jgi:hypothetical protein
VDSIDFNSFGGVVPVDFRAGISALYRTTPASRAGHMTKTAFPKMNERSTGPNVRLSEEMQR